MSLPVSTPEFWKQRIEDSKKYGDIHHSVYISRMELWKEIESFHIEILKEYKDAKVLDAGCGYGRCAPWFSDYTGVDSSPDLLDIARKDYPEKTFIEADLASLPFRDREFDVSFCISIKQMIRGNLGEEVWDEIEQELRRVSKKVLILEYEDSDKHTVLD